MNRIFQTLIFTAFFTVFSNVATTQISNPEQLRKLTAQQEQTRKAAEVLAVRQEAIRKEINRLEKDLKKTSEQARTYESISHEISERLSSLTHEEEKLSYIIRQDREALTDLLAALQRIQHTPPPTFALNSTQANTVARASILLQSITKDLTMRSESLKVRLADLQSLRASITNDRVKYEHSYKDMKGKQSELKTIIRDKASLNAKLGTDKKARIAEANKLASEANTIRDLINTFERQAETDLSTTETTNVFSIDPVPRKKPKRQVPTTSRFIPSKARRFSDARGSLPLPVLGKPRLRYGSLLNNGARSKGVSLRTAASAQVISPFTGRIEFSGNFNGDNVVILNVGDGYFIVMSGLGETFSHAGNTVKNGDPLGLMSESSSPQPELFLEFRKNRTSINPNPWIGKALAKAKT